MQREATLKIEAKSLVTILLVAIILAAAAAPVAWLWLQVAHSATCS